MTQQQVTQAINQRSESLRQDAIELLCSLIRLPSPAGSPTQAQELVARELKWLGLAPERFTIDPVEVEGHPEYTAAKPGGGENLFAAWPGQGNGRSLMLFSHIDTEPVRDPAQWDHPPYQPLIEGDRLYGLGSADSKAGVAAMIMALRVLQDANLRPKGEVQLLSILGKLGGALGTLGAMVRGYRADASIYLHPAESGAGWKQVKTASRGMLNFQIIVEGNVPPPREIGNLESALSYEGISALDKGWIIASALKRLDAQWAQDQIHDREWGRPLYLNLGSISGGDHPGRVAAQCCLQGRVVFRAPHTLSSMEEELRQLLQEVSVQDEYLRDHPPQLSFFGVRANPAQLDPEHPLVTLAKSNLKEVSGIEPDNYGLHSASDIRFPMLYANSPTIGLGPSGGGFHGPNEWVSLRDYQQSIVFLARMIMDWCQ